MGIKIKKGILLLALGAAICLGGCGKTNSVDLQEKGLELIGLMAEKAENEDYILAMSGSELLNEAAEEIGKGEYSAPQKVYRMEISIEDFIEQLNLELSSMSEELQKDVANKAAMSFGTILNGQEGSLQLAITNVIAVSSAFKQNDVTETVFYLYQFGEDENAALVAFLPAEDGVVSAYATFLANADIERLETAEEITQWLSEHTGITAMKIEEVKE